MNEATPKKKLIEVALPLPEINDASAYDKMPGIGAHPKGIHQWWARLPLPTARAVLFASVVDDPEAHPEIWPTEVAQNAERERLFDILRRMMGKKLHEAHEIYAEARQEMLRHCDGRLPVVFDPFAGGGSIPLEANRLGFEAHAGDLNPVAVLLNKCNLELAPRWTGRAPVNPDDRGRIGGSSNWHGTQGVAADVRYYGRIIRERAQAKIGDLYPKVRLPEDHGGGEATVIAWLWARTIRCSNPACGARTPLIRSFWLVRKKPRFVIAKPKLDHSTKKVSFEIVSDDKPEKETTSGKGARCLFCGTVFSKAEVRELATKNGVDEIPFAVVADGPRGRIYLPSTASRVPVVSAPDVPDVDQPMTNDRRWFSPPLYGIPNFRDLFTPRQLTAMATFSELVREIGADVERDASVAGLSGDEAGLYGQTVTTFLALAVGRCSDFNNALCRWKPSGEQLMQLFGRQAIPMVWDFAESNILGDRGVCWHTAVGICAEAVETLTVGNETPGHASQIDAATGANGISNLLVSTDPPYYDNIGYAVLSDFFYVWLRRTVGVLYKDLFSTLLVPKLYELTASPERFDGDKQKAKEHFESGFRKAFTALREKMDPRFPLTVYYAFKQDDEESDAAGDEGTSFVDLTTGWETLLEALISSGFQITATWPVRASQKWRMVSMGTNALASYIVLACRPRPIDAPRTDRRAFVAELKRDLPSALRHLQQGNIAPVDFAQAAIGPGMAIYSRYTRILENSGNAMTVRSALSLINQTLTEVLSEQEDDFDRRTRWAIPWFEQHGFADGDFGDAELLSKAKVTSVPSLQQAGLIHSKGGRVRLLRPDELPGNWDPETDERLTVWEMTHHLLRVYFHEKAGDVATADLLRKFGRDGDIARDLAYRLFDVCEKKKRSQEALAYNALVLGWPEISRLARESGRPTERQAEIFEQA
jgi:putative DNA methylase